MKEQEQQCCERDHDHEPKHTAIIEALQEVELRTTQARIASGIGRQSASKQVAFLLAELQRIADVARAALTQATGNSGGEPDNKPLFSGPCILTGAPGENPDDCTTHDHEP